MMLISAISANICCQRPKWFKQHTPNDPSHLLGQAKVADSQALVPWFCHGKMPWISQGQAPPKSTAESPNSTPQRAFTSACRSASLGRSLKMEISIGKYGKKSAKSSINGGFLALCSWQNLHKYEGFLAGKIIVIIDQ